MDQAIPANLASQITIIISYKFNYMAAGPARFARNPGCRNRAGRAEIRYVIASAEHTRLKIANTQFLF
jgi:predicted alpha/beta-hydrolase family hydrolase